MGKRGNENAQLSKEEYDALEARGGSSGGPRGNFSQASTDELGKRRIIRRARRPLPSSSPATSTSTTTGGSIGGSGVFGSIKLTSTTPAPPASTMNNMADGGKGSKPTFAMPTLPPPTRATNLFGNTRLTAPAPSAKAGASTTTTNSSKRSRNGSGSTSTTSKSTRFMKAFQRASASADIREAPFELMAQRYLTSANSLRMEEEEESDQKENKASATNTTISLSSSAPAMSANSGSLFTQTPTGASPAFSFGGSKSPSSTSTGTGGNAVSETATSPTFSFGSTTTTKGLTAASPSSTFQFSPTATVAAPTPGSNIKIALQPVPAASEAKSSSNSGDEPAAGQSEDGQAEEELESADTQDWDEVFTTKVKAHRLQGSDGFKKFAMGSIKLQQHKETKSRRMVMRDKAGKVLLNVGIYKGMAFSNESAKSKTGKVGRINFKGIMSEERGAETFCLLCRLEHLEPLHSKLEELAK